jgi:hypothetical protein
LIALAKELRMVRIRFSSHEDEVRGYYLLATQAKVRSLRGGLYEITKPCLTLLDQHAIKYVVIPPTEATLDETEAVRNSPAAEL